MLVCMVFPPTENGIEGVENVNSSRWFLFYFTFFKFFLKQDGTFLKSICGGLLVLLISTGWVKKFAGCVTLDFILLPRIGSTSGGL
jgi:hypothetical protein